jgi:Fe-S oxidoreductase
LPSAASRTASALCCSGRTPSTTIFHPQVARAATEVLEWAGYRVVLPDGPVCCGRPLYDYGMLDRAERQLRRTLRALRPALDAGLPIVGIEPSCLAVFRDELRNLMPNDPAARKLSQQSLLLSELLDRDRVVFPVLPRRAVVHGHCHHKAVMGSEAEERVLARLGLDLDVLDSGCCGMAGSFGYEQEHFEISRHIGEEVVLPRVRAASADDLVIADGFSCHSQIEGATGRRPLHLAEVIHMAIAGQTTTARPVRSQRDEHPRLSRKQAAGWALGLAALTAAGVVYARR